ncbi:MAG TPA: PEP-CTERM sorting domain-containing protein [Burkholderiales bacterium]
MSVLQKILVILAATGLPVAAVNAADSAEAAHPDSGFASSVANSYSFADIANLPAGAERLILSGGASGPSAVGSVPELSPIDHSAPLMAVASTANGVLDDLSAYSSGETNMGVDSRAGILFSTEKIPEPSGWMLLICGLAVAGFMARRKRGD